VSENCNACIRFIGYVIENDGNKAKIAIFNEYLEGLRRITDFSHLIILYWFHMRDNKKDRSTILVHPRGDPSKPLVGVFASRSPCRPNPVGLCVCRLLDIRGDCIIVEGLDAFVDSPIIDIKPYIPRIDSVPSAKIPDWLK